MVKDAVVGIKAGVAPIEKEKRTAGGTCQGAELTPPKAASNDNEVAPPIAAACEGIFLVPLHVWDIFIAPYRRTARRPASIRLNTLIDSSLNEFHAIQKKSLKRVNIMQKSSMRWRREGRASSFQMDLAIPWPLPWQRRMP